MRIHTRPIIAAIALAIAGGLAVAVSACDNPVEENHEHEGAEAAGLVLISGGEELIQVLNLEVNDTLRVPVDDSIEDIEVEFLTEDGDHIHAEDFDEEFSLAWEVADEGLVTIESTGTWSFSIRGEAAGETTMELHLRHGDHADFSTPDIPVSVD